MKHNNFSHTVRRFSLQYIKYFVGIITNVTVLGELRLFIQISRVEHPQEKHTLSILYMHNII